MDKILWKTVDVLWLVTFEMLLATAMGIPLIGATFIPLLLLFTWLFSKTVPKFGSSWITWAIPYTFSVISFLDFFMKENLFAFTFKTFWLSLASWFTSPISSFAMAVLLFIISYVMAYLTAHLLENTLNTFIVFAASAAIAGVATQYCCLLTSFGFMLLFVLSLILNGNNKREKITKPFVLVITITVVIGSIFFLMGTRLKPSTPLGHLFEFKTASAQHASFNGSSAPLAKNNVAVRVPTKGIPHTRKIVKDSGIESSTFEVIMDVVGILVISVGISTIIGMFLFKEKRKKEIRWKSLLHAIWMIASAFFIFMLMMYAFGMLNFKANHVSINLTTHMPGNIVNSAKIPSSLTATTASLPSQGGTSPITNPIIWIALAVMGFVVILYMILRFVKEMNFAGEGRKNEGNAEDNFNFNKSENNFSGEPWQIVLFYYNLLRDSSGNQSATPFEFEKVIGEKIGKENAKRVTDIFVKLRYAHSDISEKEAHFVKEQVSRVIIA